MHAILHQLRRVALLSADNGLSDEQLLEAFLHHRDEAAFEALVRRHGPMLLGVCRRVTGNAHDAEDAFQATFLVLVRKAGSLRSRQILPGWLYGVAYRTALNTRAMRNKRRAKEREAAQQPKEQASSNGPPEELLARLDEALNRLPDRYRLPVLLCELQGHSRKEAAQILGLPMGTVSWRLAHARKLLAQRLARYGTMLSAGTLAAAFPQSRATAMPARLVRAVTQQALVTGTVPGHIQTLTDGVLKAMLLSKLNVAWAVALSAIVGVGTVAVIYRPAVAADPTQPERRTASARPSQDELEELRLEIAALRRGLQVTRDRVRTLEDEVTMLRSARQGGPVIGAQPGVGFAAGPAIGAQPGVGFAAGPAGAGARAQAFRAWSGGAGTTTGFSGPAVMSGSVARPKTPGNVTGVITSGWVGNPYSVGIPGTAAMPAASGSSSAGTTASSPSVGGSSSVGIAASPTAPAGEQGRVERNRPNDPLASAQAALRQLRQHPNDRRAADRLERALKRLEAEGTKQPPAE